MPSPLFPSTRWTILAAATLSGDATGRAALERLCAAYRPPVVVFLRSRGWNPPEAEDLAQELFAQLLVSRAWKQADRSRGKFRNFLLTILQNIVSNKLVHDQAQRRGGGLVRLSLECLSEESGWEPASRELSPSEEFDLEWAVRTLRTACGNVRRHWAERGKEREFQFYSRFLPGSQLPPSYAQAAAELQVTEGAARTAVCRLRSELGDALRQQISQTVGAPEDVEEEMAYLRSVLARRNTPPREEKE